MSDSSEDRGKRFTRYRVWGGIVAGLLAITLVWQTIELFDDDARTIPEVRWGVAQDPNGVGIIVSKSLADRTNFQRATKPCPLLLMIGFYSQRPRLPSHQTF